MPSTTDSGSSQWPCRWMIRGSSPCSTLWMVSGVSPRHRPKLRHLLEEAVVVGRRDQRAEIRERLDQLAVPAREPPDGPPQPGLVLAALGPPSSSVTSPAPDTIMPTFSDRIRVRQRLGVAPR